MRDIRMFVEDFGHQEVVGTLVRRVAGESGRDLRARFSEWQR